MCDRHQSRTDAPQKKEAREELFMKRFEEQAKRYLAEIRKSALIEFK